MRHTKRSHRIFYRALLGSGATRVPWVRRRVFGLYFADNAWGSGDSRSGGGSNLEQTATIRRELPLLCTRLGINSLLDVPCGDGHWWGHVDHQLQRYIGVDVVPAMIEERRKHARPNEQYICADVATDPLPRADAVFCRDLLVHFSEADIRRTLRNLRASGATYLITTTFPGRTNVKINTGQWRPIDLQASPFDFPAPRELINEKCTENEGRFADKSLGVWLFSELPSLE